MVLCAFIGAGRLLGAAGLRHDLHLLLLQCRCCVRGVYLVGGGFYRPGEAKGPFFFPQKTPRPRSKRPGVPFYACTITMPRGAFTSIINVHAR